MTPLPEVGRLTRADFERDWLPRHQPVVLRGQVADWPLVQAARAGDDHVARELLSLSSNTLVDALLLAPQHRGRIFYGPEGEGFNFIRNRLPLDQLLEQVQRYARFDPAPAVAAQSAPVADCLPGFGAAHALDLVPRAATARLWLGTAIVTPAHFDESANIACVVAGQRRFTLFAPEQVGNLAVGPIGNAPTGTPISLIDLDAPDLLRHPGATQALQAAQQATLGPGDAIYVPPLWWHHVASLSALNVMVSHWWAQQPDSRSALPALLHTLLALRDLPLPQRRAWQSLFAHWVFEADENTSAHLPPALLGVHGPLTADLRQQLLAFIAQRLKD